jgi:hypothetical protein
MLACASSVAQPQATAVRKLGARAATYAEPFTTIESVRELRDGRVLVTDPRDKAIKLIDFAKQAAVSIGRDGDGPGEFRMPLKILALPGDSSAVRDLVRYGKGLVITPSGKPGGLIDVQDSAKRQNGAEVAMVDASGNYFGLYYAFNRFVDSGAIVRWRPGSARRDTITRFDTRPISPLYKGPPTLSPTGGFRPSPMPFATANSWAASMDGRVAIVSAEPYQVTLIAPGGARIRGEVMRIPRLAVTDADKAEYAAQFTRPGPTIRYSRGSNQMIATYEKSPVVPDEFLNPPWPPSIPFIPREAAIFASDGVLWVRRNVRAGSPHLYDLFDRAARPVALVELPPKTRLIGFGVGVVYLDRVDDDDLHYLERYKLPAR